MNKKTVVFLFGIFLSLTAASQSFIGYGYDNYSGISGALLNPGTLADSKYKVYVNIFAISGFAGNNAYEMDRSRLLGLHFPTCRKATVIISPPTQITNMLISIPMSRGTFRLW